MGMCLVNDTVGIPMGKGRFCVAKMCPVTDARAGILETSHGRVLTPVFMPVGTQGSVKAVAPEELVALGVQILLCNTYHLHLRPGEELVADFGGLHAFIGWDGPILTDSGGYQVFSLAKLRKITEEGVFFQNHLDGSPTVLTPESSMEIQQKLGADVVMAFDECPPYGCSEVDLEEAVRRTVRWAERGLAWWAGREERTDRLLFGIVQGGTHEKLRRDCALALVEMGFDGYAIGGVSVGEPEGEMMVAIEASMGFLPTKKPRYAMGIGEPNQIVEMVARGVDMFDCVLPTRMARHGTAYCSTGKMNLRNSCYARDKEPIERGCSCPACRKFSRAYIRHLLVSGEILGMRLLTLHNLHFYTKLMAEIRGAILKGVFHLFREKFLEGWIEGELERKKMKNSAG
ncbi:MAG: tRNA guanosine(34) transglycosylase Tgt [Chthoniobacterales bacterium]|nr:tRNA guanosine(34) transglycosylase Tgt [Chthoniobacterales bacterium]